MTKGEKLVTNLVGRKATPKIVHRCNDCGVENTRHKIECSFCPWPKRWKSVDTLTPDGNRLVEIVAVYLKEGSVWLLVRNVYEGAMIETPAEEWAAYAP